MVEFLLSTLLDGRSGFTRRRSEAIEQVVVLDKTYGLPLKKEGALPGSADWTHQYGDVANTIKSNDSRVKLPLGAWFGGSSHMDVLPRHGHGPPEQVVGGRLFIQGIDCLSARDVHTPAEFYGRKSLKTWVPSMSITTSTFEDVLLNPKYNQVHIPGAKWSALITL